MHAGMSLSDKLQCVGQSEEKFPTQQRTEALHALSTLINMAYKWVCPATLFCAIFFVGLFCCCNTAKPRDGEKREAYIHPVNDEVYDTLLLLVQGKFEVPVSKRTRIQRNTVVRFWRRREPFHLGPERTPTLYFAGKKVVKKSLISTIVGNTFKQAKSGGCKKLGYRAASSYAGLSEKKILQVTNNEFKY